MSYSGKGTSLQDQWRWNQVNTEPDFHDQYVGVYSYKPKTSFCVQGDNGYISFDWNKQTVPGIAENEGLLINLLPHHVSPSGI